VHSSAAHNHATTSCSICDPLAALARDRTRARRQSRADPPSVHREPARLVAFSDAVFAITITLLVLEIRPPSDYTHLLHGLGSLWPSYLSYAVTFLFIGQVWANHHVMFDHIQLPTASSCSSTLSC